MAYTYRVFRSPQHLDLDDWNRVHSSAGDAFTDPRFLRTVQRCFGETAPCHPVFFYDERDRAVAISTVSACSIDAALLAVPRLRKAVDWVRRVWPNYLRFKIVMCGLPVMVLHKRLCLLPDADSGEVLRLLEETLSDFAAQQRARILLMGDFDAGDRPWLDALCDRGYLQADSPPAYLLEASFADFQEYCRCLRAGYRRQVRSDRRPFAVPGVSVEHFSGGEHSSQQFTDELYDFYLRVVDRVDVSLTTLPGEFFREVIRQFHDEVHLLKVLVEGRPAAFELGLTWQGTYHLLFVAYDVEKNERYRLYFNLFHEAIDYALRSGVDAIDLGVFADSFKHRLGGRPQPRTVYLKVRGLLACPFRLFSGWLLPSIPLPEEKRVFARPP